ncbi:hypothetical protein [Cupriavidus basilensis]|uniref:hypothetical protein n=1 Tax=Cupriavidus basilensis TaxID=68895 RepID=UPI0039F6CFDB
MPIQNFPAALVPIIQQGFLEREFQDGLESVTAFRNIADREPIPNKVGETITKTRAGLKAPTTTPLAASGNTNLDNGLSPTTWTVEQYVLTMAMYGDTIDLNTVTNRVGIVEQFMQNAKVNGVQSSQSLDRLARNALFNAYIGGNTRVRTTLGAPALTIAVDDVRGYLNGFVGGVYFGGGVLVNGVMTPISPANPLNVVVGSNVYSLTAVAVDGSNASTAPGGISGTLTFAGNVTVADGTAANPVVSSYAPTILRPNGRATTAALTGTDLLTMGLCLDAVAQLRNNAVPARDGLYDVFLDNKSARQLFADPDFKLLFQGQDAAKEFRQGRVIELLDCRFVPTTEALQQSLGSINVKRPIVCGAGALIEGDFDGMGETDTGTGDALKSVVDDIVQVTRPPLDRLQQIIAQSWYWIGGYAVPTDATATQNIIPTAAQTYWKRAIVLETA